MRTTSDATRTNTHRHTHTPKNSKSPEEITMAFCGRPSGLLLLLLLVSSCFLNHPSCSEAISSEPKVSLALYYESLCPYCSRFIVNRLANIFRDGLVDVVDLDLVPYGNARVGSNNTISCQHGPYECLLNTIEACAINAWPDLNVHFNFIYCVESLVVEHQYLEWESCFSKLGLDPKPVLDCYKNGYGQKLELQYAAQTDSLQPPHRYVPWVVVNGKPLYDDYESFEAEVCKAYKGDLPNVCEGLVLKNPKGMESDGGACYRDELSLPSTEDDGMKIKMVV